MSQFVESNKCCHCSLLCHQNHSRYWALPTGAPSLWGSGSAKPFLASESLASCPIQRRLQDKWPITGKVCQPRGCQLAGWRVPRYATEWVTVGCPIVPCSVGHGFEVIARPMAKTQGQSGLCVPCAFTLQASKALLARLGRL